MPLLAGARSWSRRTRCALLLGSAAALVASPCLAAQPDESDRVGLGDLIDTAGAVDAPPEILDCRPWPSEPDPLPRVGDEDPVADGWAAERSAWLAGRAQATEKQSPDEAERLWERVLCLNPWSEEASGGLARIERIRVEPRPSGARPAADRLPAVSSSSPNASPNGAGAAAVAVLPASYRVEPAEVIPWVPLGAPAAARRPHSEGSGGARFDYTSVDQELGEIRSLLEEAHFRTALAVATATANLLDQADPSAAVDVRRARLEIMRATAEVALGRTAEARVHMLAALSANPEIELDAGSVSPKVMALFADARSGAGTTLAPPIDFEELAP